MSSDSSPNLALPFLMPSQAQKHVTHNEALGLLDLLVQLTVRDFGATTPPVLPEEGEVWALGAAPLGEWAGQAGLLAAWSGGAWIFVEPRPGWRAAGLADGSLRVWSGTGWDRPGLDNLDGLGIGTAHDATNRLAVSSPATLLSHAGSDHRLFLNKATVIDTASLLFQSGWSGRAEMGLAGDDDFAVKVSADGSIWTEALRVTAATGAVTAPAGLQISGHGAYHRGNLLGAVGQSGGLPTGAVIETGSNANGRYLRYADGTQICWRDTVLSQSVAANSYAEATWVYPAGFAGSMPHPTASIRSFNDAAGRQNAARHLRGVGGGIGLSSGAVGVFNAHTSAIETRIDAFVIGRWF